MVHLQQGSCQEKEVVSHHLDAPQEEAGHMFALASYVHQLFEAAQDLCHDIHHKDSSNLCHLIERIVQGRAYIIFHPQQANVHLSSKMHSSFPLQFGKSVYGMLYIPADPDFPDQPALPLALAQSLAQLYGWLLYTCEQTAIVQGQCQRLEYHLYGALSKRESQVLNLICRGFTQEKIAQTLGITEHTVIKHKQRIYYQLGVHTENDALIAAYQTGLVSLLKTAT